MPKEQKQQPALNRRFRYRCNKNSCPERKGDWTTSDAKADQEAKSHNDKYPGHHAVVEEEYSQP